MREIYVKSDLKGYLRVTATFSTVDEANRYMESHPTEGVVCVEGSVIFLADNRDEGSVTIPYTFRPPYCANCGHANATEHTRGAGVNVFRRPSHKGRWECDVCFLLNEGASEAHRASREASSRTGPLEDNEPGTGLRWPPGTRGLV